MYPEDTMRSKLVFGAMAHVPNRFLLTKLAAKATRKLHRPNTRIQETINDMLVRFSRSNPVAGARQPANLQPFLAASENGIQSHREHQNDPWLEASLLEALDVPDRPEARYGNADSAAAVAR
jgi:hypothetical protein